MPNAYEDHEAEWAKQERRRLATKADLMQPRSIALDSLLHHYRERLAEDRVNPTEFDKAIAEALQELRNTFCPPKGKKDQ